MKVKLLVGRCGADFSQSPGDIVDVTDGEAARMIEAGQAEPLRFEQKQNASKKQKSEKAVK